MFRYFCAESNIEDNKVKVISGDARHLKTILRAQLGDIISVITESHEYRAEIINISNDEVICFLKEKVETNNETNVNITLCQGIPKQTKMETIIQQNVELGVKRFIPLITERTVVKINDKDRELKKLERWRKIAKESAKQSKRNIVPQVENIVTLKDFVKSIKNENSQIIVPYELENGKTLSNVLKEQKNNYYIVIGPEGGFDIKEIEMLEEIGGQVVTLGKRILRTETAGVVTSAVVLYECNEMI
ncbi:RsmE family RNA methyltransferase [Sedimentibacter sp. MB31-C6]|uniref:RsmE family RNA methyltransferase n=1 Tax=Sedimentibacter sp. MB31-C6 TaxID=3109366 RepID=UPI002DDCF2B7|nr:RsmE family RNA methyltransferase [Sedimentibacter sp. MB36-C1]WSI03795.1 RsmE family RNA methyltransferase [Sedimentibacter sp. MB36-C1]